MSKKASKGGYVLLLMTGLFTTIIATIGYAKTPGVTDFVLMGSGIAMMGVSIYRLIEG